MEDIETKPQSPYAISKKAQEEMAKVYVNAYGLKICMTRSFNHSGAGHQEGFIIPDFAAGIVRIENGQDNELKTGNLTAKRDFTHVKDVVRAYRLIAEKGRPGDVYNVGSGESHSAQEVLDLLISMAKCDVIVKKDPKRMRPNDTPLVCCNHDKLTNTTGWEPRIRFADIVRDSLQYYRGENS